MRRCRLALWLACCAQYGVGTGAVHRRMRCGRLRRRAGPRRGAPRAGRRAVVRGASGARTSRRELKGGEDPLRPDAHRFRDAGERIAGHLGMGGGGRSATSRRASRDGLPTTLRVGRSTAPPAAEALASTAGNAIRIEETPEIAELERIASQKAVQELVRALTSRVTFRDALDLNDADEIASLRTEMRNPRLRRPRKHPGQREEADGEAGHSVERERRRAGGAG